MFFRRLMFVGVAILAGVALVTVRADAALDVSYQFQGNGNWSLDAVGSNADNPVGTIDAIVPVGSTIEVAFLYSSMFVTGNVPEVNFDGTVYSGADWTSLGVNSFLEAYRVDVTAQVAAVVGSGSATPFAFDVIHEDPNLQIDGEALAIIYSNPNEQERTIAFLDGFGALAGDQTTVFLADPLTQAQLDDANFEALMSLGIGYGYQTSNSYGQYSQVDVNSQRLTTSAGGQDDGVPTSIGNGGLITMGGIGDDADNNPADPTFSGPSDPLGARYDDELYSLSSFLSVADTQIQIDTINPSNDDNIFFLGINITAAASVNEDPVPEPATILLFGSGLLGLGIVKRRRTTV